MGDMISGLVTEFFWFAMKLYVISLYALQVSTQPLPCMVFWFQAFVRHPSLSIHVIVVDVISLQVFFRQCGKPDNWIITIPLANTVYVTVVLCLHIVQFSCKLPHLCLPWGQDRTISFLSCIGLLEEITEIYLPPLRDHVSTQKVAIMSHLCFSFMGIQNCHLF